VTDFGPVQLGRQLTLFPFALDDLVADASVSNEEIREWHEQGLLSFGPDEAAYQDFHLAELEFVAAIMRAGLSRAMVKTLLGKLAKPYRYNPRLVCYNFLLGQWRQLPSQSEDELRERHFEEFQTDFLQHLETYLDGLVEASEGLSVEDVYDRVRMAMRKVSDTSERKGGNGEEDG
jgi:hypothetical protein